MGWPQFKYINKDPFDSTSYKHWGIEKSATGVSVNPNNPGMQCVTSDFALTYGGAWGWNDVDCAMVTTTAICKIPRERCCCAHLPCRLACKRRGARRTR